MRVIPSTKDVPIPGGFAVSCAHSLAPDAASGGGSSAAWG